MSKAASIINQLSEIGYYGQHDDYGTKAGTQDANAYKEPFKDVELPDTDKKQTKAVKRSSDKPGKENV